MEKLGLIVKNFSANRIKSYLKESSGFLVIGYSGLSSPDVSSLRQILRGNNAILMVVRNNVAKKTLKDLGLEHIVKFIDGPCGLIFVKGEPVNVSKILCDFNKQHEPLKIAGGVIEQKILEKKDIEVMAKLPSKEILRAQVVNALNSPIVKLVMVLNGNLRKLVYCLEQIKQKKEKNN